MDDWDSLRSPLQEACESPQDEDAIKRAVDAAELVASTAGEPPDELPDEAGRRHERVVARAASRPALPTRRRRRSLIAEALRLTR
jgi:hypothetical protein